MNVKSSTLDPQGTTVTLKCMLSTYTLVSTKMDTYTLLASDVIANEFENIAVKKSLNNKPAQYTGVSTPPPAVFQLTQAEPHVSQ